MVIVLKHNILGVLFYLIIKSWLVETKSINPENCCNFTKDIYSDLGSRTPYGFIRGKVEHVEGCTPLQIWITATQSARYPNSMAKQHMLDLETLRDRIAVNHENGRGQLCFKDLTNLRSWWPDSKIYQDKFGYTGDEGKKELHYLTKRLKSAFPEILQSNDPTDYSFMATNKERVTSSLLSFANALLNTNETADYEEELKKSEECPRWKKEHLHEEQMAEYTKFKDGPVMQKTLMEISQRLGFSETIGFDIVNVMYDVCRFETSLESTQISVWCSVFSTEDLMVFKYLSYLDYYYCCGPGNRLGRKLNCAILQKLLKAFTLLEQGNVKNQPSGIFKIGQSSNIQPVMSLFKVFDREEPLLASNYESLKNRIGNTTFMDAITSNIVAAFYRCDNVTMPNQVQFHIGKNPVQIPGCEGRLCDWEYLKQEFQAKLQQCNVNNYCDLQNNTITNASRNFICSDFILMIFFTFSYCMYIF